VLVGGLDWDHVLTETTFSRSLRSRRRPKTPLKNEIGLSVKMSKGRRWPPFSVRAQHRSACRLGQTDTLSTVNLAYEAK
jgi:hypothetical protein